MTQSITIDADKGMVALGFDERDYNQTIARAWADAHEVAELQFVIERDEARRAAKLARAA